MPGGCRWPCSDPIQNQKWLIDLGRPFCPSLSSIRHLKILLVPHARLVLPFPIWPRTSPKIIPYEVHRILAIATTHLFTWFPINFRWFVTLATLYSTSIANPTSKNSEQNSCTSVLTKTLAVIKPRNQITSTGLWLVKTLETSLVTDYMNSTIWV